MEKRAAEGLEEQISAVQTWRQVRGFAGAVVIEKCDFVIKWYTFLFERQVALDMRVVCPQDVQKMLLKQAMIDCPLKEIWQPSTIVRS